MNSRNTGDRNKTLLIVEGYHEKNKFFSLLFWCFHEFNIKQENVWVYETNIYQLYDDIVKEYGEDWFKNHDDIDLPFVVSKKKETLGVQYKNSFTNIIIVFDYERHAPEFSERKIEEMQETFSDPADMGKLYINYPMMEAAYHLTSLPDEDYISRDYTAAIRTGTEYKGLVRNESCITWEFDLPVRLDDILANEYGLEDETQREKCCNELLELSADRVSVEIIKDVLNEYLDEKNSTLSFQLTEWIKRSKHYMSEKNYRQYMRNIFQLIAKLNIDKALFIQTGETAAEENSIDEAFDRIDFLKILHRQNCYSKEKDLIWVLCTSVLFIADYNTKLLVAE